LGQHWGSNHKETWYGFKHNANTEKNEKPLKGRDKNMKKGGATQKEITKGGRKKNQVNVWDRIQATNPTI